jgi:hypothetical protein
LLILTFMIAVLNLCLGFALAMYLGYGQNANHEASKTSDLNPTQATGDPDTPLSYEFSSENDENIESLSAV